VYSSQLMLLLSPNKEGSNISRCGNLTAYLCVCLVWFVGKLVGQKSCVPNVWIFWSDEREKRTPQHYILNASSSPNWTDSHPRTNRATSTSKALNHTSYQYNLLVLDCIVCHCWVINHRINSYGSRNWLLGGGYLPGRLFWFGRYRARPFITLIRKHQRQWQQAKPQQKNQHTKPPPGKLNTRRGTGIKGHQANRTCIRAREITNKPPCFMNLDIDVWHSQETPQSPK